MRRLTQPPVVAAAAAAATLSAALSLPRMLLWDQRPFPVWYPEAMILFCGFVLWAFVFAWHTEYTRRPLFTFKINSPLLALATLLGVVTALGLHWLLDPALRVRNPQDYPVDFTHWMAHTLFALSFTQLFLLFAPFAWAVRLFRNERVAIWLTVALNVLVLALKSNASPTPLPALLLVELLTLRIAFGYFAIWFYLRGGIFLVWWLSLLVEARHLLTFQGL
jgi:hypothetical protein